MVPEETQRIKAAPFPYVAKNNVLMLVVLCKRRMKESAGRDAVRSALKGTVSVAVGT